MEHAGCEKNGRRGSNATKCYVFFGALSSSSIYGTHPKIAEEPRLFGGYPAMLLMLLVSRLVGISGFRRK
jgi:hypothetical protein